jgi:alpha-tubulin suppressor-like RCC1 family protein
MVALLAVCGCFGGNEGGTLGGKCVVQVAAGASHTCARGFGGALWCWGDNSSGQVGRGDREEIKQWPVHVVTLGSEVVDVATGGAHTCARKKDDTLWCWGDNTYGQLGIEMQAGTEASLSLLAAPDQVTAVGRDVAELVAGANHTCIRKKDGSVWCWGSNVFGQLGDATDQVRVVASPVPVRALGVDAVQLAAGASHTCARKRDGTLWCWGQSLGGQLGNGTRVWSTPTPVKVKVLEANVTSVTAGDSHTCARKTDGTIWCWGRNHFGELGDGIGDDGKQIPVPVGALGTDVVEVEAGAHHTCARKQDGAIWCWGSNKFGQLGPGRMEGLPKQTPAQVMRLGLDTLDMAAGEHHTCVRKLDNTLRCWGLNSAGQLGDGTTKDRTCLEGKGCKPTPTHTLVPCP